MYEFEFIYSNNKIVNTLGFIYHRDDSLNEKAYLQGVVDAFRSTGHLLRSVMHIQRDTIEMVYDPETFFDICMTGYVPVEKAKK